MCLLDPEVHIDDQTLTCGYGMVYSNCNMGRFSIFLKYCYIVRHLSTLKLVQILNCWWQRTSVPISATKFWPSLELELLQLLEVTEKR